MKSEGSNERRLHPTLLCLGDLPALLGWGALGMFAILFHQLCVIPGLLDYSVYGFILLLAGACLLVYLLPAEGGRQYLVFILAALFAYEALSSVRHWSIFGQATAAVLILAVIAAAARLYARLDLCQLAALGLAALVVFAFAPGEQIRAINHFVLSEESPNMYGGEVFTYFPLRVGDFAGEGEMQVVSWGNREELLAERDAGEDEEEIRGEPHILAPETVYPYVFSWKNGGLTRTSVADIPAPALDEAADALTGHYPAFPYYSARSSGKLQPLISPEELTDAALHFARAPATAVDLVQASAAARLAAGGADEADFPDAGIRDVHLTGDRMKCRWDDRDLVLFTDATEIIGPLRLGDDGALVLLGASLQIVQLNDGGEDPQLQVTHELTADEFSDVGLVDPLIADVDGDGSDELLLSSAHTPSRIVKPEQEGGFRLLWIAEQRDETFRFEDVHKNGDGPPEIIAQRQSLVRDVPYRYLTGYHYADGQLHSSWRSMFNMVDVHARDLTGDGSSEVIGLRYGAHRFWVLRPHGIPVTRILWGIAGLLAACLVLFRFRDLPPGRPRWWLVAVCAAVVLIVALVMVFSARLSTYPSAGSVPEVEDAGKQKGDVPDAAEFGPALEEAIGRGRDEGRFWYTGWIASFVGKRQVNSMYDGTVYLPHGYVSNVRVAANPLRLFRWEGEVFIEERERWFEEEVPNGDVDLLGGFARFLTVADEFAPGGQDAVMGMPCTRYEAELSLREWRELLGPGASAASVPAGADENAEVMFGQGSVQVEIWIASGEPLLHKYRTVIRLPLPGAGETKQEILFRFYRYGDPNIEPVDLQKIQGYLHEQRREFD